MATRDIYETAFDEADGQTTNASTCPECKGRLETEGGETSCVSCGLIVNDYWIDHGAERLDYPDTEPRERTGQPLTETRHDRGLSAEIGWGNRDAKGNVLSAEKRRRVGRMRREHSRARWETRAERNLASGLGDIARMVGRLDLAWTVREQASHLFRTAHAEELCRGRSLEMLTSGSVYAACRTSGVTVTRADVAEVASCSLREVTHGYRVLNRELGLDAMVVRSQTLLPQLASAFDVPNEVRIRALELAEEATKRGLDNGRSPSGVAAACLYLAAHEHGWLLTQTDVADAAGVSVATLRKRKQELQTVDRAV